MSNSLPLVSVIMAVKNGGKLVCKAIESILDQTYINVELIIINDGSTDSTLEIIKEFKDTRIIILSQENQGLSKSLNRGFGESKGKYIARQDHDDLSMPTRLAKQVEYLELHPECGLVGTRSEIWSENNRTPRYHDHPTKPGVLAFELLFNNPFVHTSWMLRAEVIQTIGLYTTDPLREPPEDYEYISRIMRQYSVANLAERLVIYREMPNSLSSQIRPDSMGIKNTFASRLALISAENLAFANNIDMPNKDCIGFGELTHSYNPISSNYWDLKKIKALIINAANNLYEKHGDQEIIKLLKNKIDFINYKYFYMKYHLYKKKNYLYSIFYYFIYKYNISLLPRLKKYLNLE